MYDLSAGFDVVDPNILCKKLEVYGSGVSRKNCAWGKL